MNITIDGNVKLLRDIPMLRCTIAYVISDEFKLRDIYKANCKTIYFCKDKVDSCDIYKLNKLVDKQEYIIFVQSEEAQKIKSELPSPLISYIYNLEEVLVNDVKVNYTDFIIVDLKNEVYHYNKLLVMHKTITCAYYIFNWELIDLVGKPIPTNFYFMKRGS